MVLHTIISGNTHCGSIGSTLMKNRWYIGEGYNGGLTTLEACVILAIIIYLIIEVIQWIN